MSVHNKKNINILLIMQMYNALHKMQARINKSHAHKINHKEKSNPQLFFCNCVYVFKITQIWRI